MRISDWSSDVCSSDLSSRRCPATPSGHPHGCPCACSRWSADQAPDGRLSSGGDGVLGRDQVAEELDQVLGGVGLGRDLEDQLLVGFLEDGLGVQPLEADLLAGLQRQRGRSEEHTSELQSLLRISYAVLCVKKKK